MKAALIISIVFQLVAAIIAFSLTRQTKFNISWILISIAFLLIAIRRILDLVPIYYKELQSEIYLIDRILGILTSVLLLAGVIYIRRLFNFLKRIDDIRRESENRVLQAIMQTEEKERRQFAKDLHDGIGPLLSNIKMSVSALDKTQINGFNLTVVDNINILINESITSLKYTSNNLSPHVLENFGLSSAVNSFIENINRLGQIDISFNSNIENTRFDSQIETNLYRIICELFQNTVKHASAGKVSLLVHFHEGRLVVQYFDDGVGFDPGDGTSVNGMGLSNMRSRLKPLNGDIEFKRIMPKGMMTSIMLKLKAKTAAHGKTKYTDC
ncbi:MAG TPA: ATP-binding protein [Bacteroidales bacterium]|nr:ATP-binding protein [Bacteroidales bacterium]